MVMKLGLGLGLVNTIQKRNKPTNHSLTTTEMRRGVTVSAAFAKV